MAYIWKDFTQTDLKDWILKNNENITDWSSVMSFELSAEQIESLKTAIGCISLSSEGNIWIDFDNNSNPTEWRITAWDNEKKNEYNVCFAFTDLATQIKVKTSTNKSTGGKVTVGTKVSAEEVIEINYAIDLINAYQGDKLDTTDGKFLRRGQNLELINGQVNSATTYSSRTSAASQISLGLYGAENKRIQYYAGPQSDNSEELDHYFFKNLQNYGVAGTSSNSKYWKTGSIKGFLIWQNFDSEDNKEHSIQWINNTTFQFDNKSYEVGHDGKILLLVRDAENAVSDVPGEFINPDTGLKENNFMGVPHWQGATGRYQKGSLGYNGSISIIGTRSAVWEFVPRYLKSGETESPNLRDYYYMTIDNTTIRGYFVPRGYYGKVGKGQLPSNLTQTIKTTYKDFIQTNIYTIKGPVLKPPVINNFYGDKMQVYYNTYYDDSPNVQGIFNLTLAELNWKSFGGKASLSWTDPTQYFTYISSTYNADGTINGSWYSTYSAYMEVTDTIRFNNGISAISAFDMISGKINTGSETAKIGSKTYPEQFVKQEITDLTESTTIANAWASIGYRIKYSAENRYAYALIIYYSK